MSTAAAFIRAGVPTDVKEGVVSFLEKGPETSRHKVSADMPAISRGGREEYGDGAGASRPEKKRCGTAWSDFMDQRR